MNDRPRTGGAGPSGTTGPGRPVLTIGIPAFNEERTLPRCIGSVVSALAALPDPRQVEILLVDDGSTDATAVVAADLIGGRGRVVSQVNRGRAAARRVILDHALGTYVLMLDAHVALGETALSWWLAADRPAPLSGDLTTELNSPYAQFWDTLTTFGWRSYLTDRRPVSFGLDDFDRYPKGTGMFLAQRSAWLNAYRDSGLEELGDSATASDDTRLLRAMAAEQRIWLQPEFTGVYVPPRSTLREFLSNARYRGTTFVDSYWESPSIVGRAVRGLPPAVAAAAVVGGITAVRSRTAAAALVSLGALAPSAGVAAMAVSTGRPPRQTAVSAALAPAFAIAFGTGLVRGYAAKARAPRSAALIDHPEQR